MKSWPFESLPLTGHRLERPTPAILKGIHRRRPPCWGLGPKSSKKINPNSQASSLRLLGPAGRKDSKKARLNDRPGEASRRQLTLARRPAAGLPVWLKPPLPVALNAASRTKPQPSAQGSGLIPKLQPFSPGSSVKVLYRSRSGSRVAYGQPPPGAKPLTESAR